MRLTVLGRSPARPNPGEACAGYLVEGGGSRILMDVGPGVVAQLLRRNTPDELDAVVISHMHTDHCLDLITLRYSYPWIDVAKHRLTVIVPPGSTGQLAEMALGARHAKRTRCRGRLVGRIQAGAIRGSRAASARSRKVPAAMTRASSPRGATSWIEAGSPCSAGPQGSASAGQPSALKG